MADTLSTTLPAGLRTKENLAKVKRGIKQWSQLVAWSWSDYTAFSDAPEKASQEKELKQFFRDTLQDQAKNRNAAVYYGDPQAAETAQALSEIIKKLFAGDKDIEGLEKVQLTLPEVLNKLTGEDFIFSTDADFRAVFRFEVIVDEFSGSIRDDEKQQGHYVAYVTYPPRPVLSEATVTEAQLEEWMRDQGSGEYLPPSAYIPLSAS